MARHAQPVTPGDDASPGDDPTAGDGAVSADLRARAPSRRRDWLGPVVLVWLGGWVVGLFAVLGVAARFTCSPGATGTACRPVGTAVGVVLVLAAVAVVTVGTVSLSDSRTWLSRGGRLALAAIALIAVYLAAHALLLTA